MRLQAFVVLILFAAGAGLSLLNPGTVMKMETVQVPGRSYEIPLGGALLAASGAALVLLYALNTATNALEARARRRLEKRLAEQEREIAEMKSRTDGEVVQKIDLLKEELSARIAGLQKLVEGRRPSSAEGSSSRPKVGVG